VRNFVRVNKSHELVGLPAGAGSRRRQGPVHQEPGLRSDLGHQRRPQPGRHLAQPRHNFGTRRLQAGGDIYKLSRILVRMPRRRAWERTMLRPAFRSCVVAVAILRQRRTLQTRSQRSFGHRTRRGFTSSCGTPSRRFPRTPAPASARPVPAGAPDSVSCNAMGGASSAPTMTAAWATPGARPAASNHVSDRRLNERRRVPQASGCAIRAEKPATPLEHELPSHGSGSERCEDDSSAACTAFGCNVTTARCPADCAPSEPASTRLRPGRRASRPAPFRSCLAQFLSVAGP
jgi:hypothetical protein